MIALHELLSAPHADNTPVCRDGASMLDAASFRSHVLNAAAVLRSQTAQRVALCIDDPFHFACVLFALFACGKTPVVPANSTQGYLADLAGAYDALLTDADVPTLIAHASSARPAAATHIAIDPHAPLVLFTSGSSGTPKPVHKTLAQFDAEVRTLERQWGALAGTATMLASVPHHHIYGLLFRVLWPLAAGRAFDRTLITDPSQLQARLAQVGTAIVVSTPAQLSRWPSLEGFASLRSHLHRSHSFRQAVRSIRAPRPTTRPRSAPRRSRSTVVPKPAALHGAGRATPMHGSRSWASMCVAMKTARLPSAHRISTTTAGIALKTRSSSMTTGAFVCRAVSIA